jgi:NAD(P)-dependent dehydrogenase (short-subunit alcohol dehydrogenase family)
MPGRLAGRRVLVTDAAEFMGPDIVPLFREEGAEVIADTRDLRAPGACDALLAETGRVDVLMANLAGGTDRIAVLDTPDSELDDCYDRMVRPLHRLTRAVLPQMIARRRGKIVVVGSATALRGTPMRAAYAAARAAQHGYVRTVGTEVAPHGVNVLATGQTFVENPSYFPPEVQATAEFRERLKGLPAGRLSTGREAAMFLLALAGAESDWIFGQVFAYAGGWVV